MPFADVHGPSIQLGLLKAIAASHGFPVRTLHANLDFAARTQLPGYDALSGQRRYMVGDWLFSGEAFEKAAPDPDAQFMEEAVGHLSVPGTSTDALRDWLLRMRRDEVPAYLDHLVDALPWGDFAVVGFTCTYQQTVASIALARRLKERWPSLFTVFGGANFDGEMGPELVTSVSCIDACVVGEGDVAFPGLLSALAEGRSLAGLPGVARRVDGGVVAAPPSEPLRTLDALPVPDYDEYFQHAKDLGLRDGAAVRSASIPVETARGCWWGAKHHCVFCGLNGTTMEFRAKSPERVLTELSELASRYRTVRFEAVDNILDTRYLKTLLPRLVDSGTNYEIFYEVKANLTRADLRLLREAGVTHIQPGLESLSSRVLGLMRKGVTAAQNVNLLRWACYYDIAVSWNLLWGFPGEAEQDYTQQADVVPHLVHLQPPDTEGPIWMERFSPLYDQHRERPEPARSYRYIFPSAVDLDKVAYFFEYTPSPDFPAAYEELSRALVRWRDVWRGEDPPRLTFWSAPHYVQIYDERHKGREGTYEFQGVLADLYLGCVDRPTGAQAVVDKLGLDLPVEAVQEAFCEFQRRGLMFLDGQRAVALALPPSRFASHLHGGCETGRSQARRERE